MQQRFEKELLRNNMSLNTQEIIAAAVNTSTETFTLGDREFPLLNLKYKDYMQFVEYCAPLIDVLLDGLKASSSAVSLPGGIKLAADKLSAVTILNLVGKNLPKMVQLMCRQSDPTVTEDQVMDLAGTPFVLIKAVTLQIKKNNMTQDFGNFFQLVAATLFTKK